MNTRNQIDMDTHSRRAKGSGDVNVKRAEMKTDCTIRRLLLARSAHGGLDVEDDPSDEHLNLEKLKPLQPDNKPGDMS